MNHRRNIGGSRPVEPWREAVARDRGGEHSNSGRSRPFPSNALPPRPFFSQPPALPFASRPTASRPPASHPFAWRWLAAPGDGTEDSFHTADTSSVGIESDHPSIYSDDEAAIDRLRVDYESSSSSSGGYPRFVNRDMYLEPTNPPDAWYPPPESAITETDLARARAFNASEKRRRESVGARMSSCWNSFKEDPCLRIREALGDSDSDL